MARAWLDARGHFGDEQPTRGNVTLPCFILGRVRHVESARDDGDRPGLDRSVVRGAVDPARQSRHHADAFAAKLMRKSPGEAARSGAGIARADDRYHRLIE